MKFRIRTFLYIQLPILFVYLSMSGQELSQTSLTLKKLTDVSFSDSLNGWIVGWDNSVFHTSDGGTHWDSIIISHGYYSSNNRFNKISSPNPKTIWVTLNSGDGGYTYLLKSIDGGIIWDTVLTTTTGHIGATWLHTVAALDSLHAWVIGGGTGLSAQDPPNKRTNDGGKSWYQYTFNDSLYCSGIKDIEFISDSVIYLFDWCNHFYRSINGGLGWDIFTIDSSYLYQDMSSPDSNHVWLVGTNGRIIKSNNGGASWANVISNSMSTLNAVQAIDSLTLWAIGECGTILRSTNGGDVWDSIVTSASTNLNGICFSDRNHGWIVGDSGVIIQYHDGTITNTETITDIPKSFGLYQNYPNPFNPTTTISYSLSAKAFVTLKIFDALGREVMTMVTEEQPSGNYYKKWNAENLPSGIYYYRLRTDSYTETRKLILLK